MMRSKTDVSARQDTNQYVGRVDDAGADRGIQGRGSKKLLGLYNILDGV
jgi:hypothetical protein